MGDVCRKISETLQRDKGGRLMYKFVRIWALVMMVTFLTIGVFGICDGVHSVAAGGYADNIVLGAIIASLFPLACFCLYLAAREWECSR